MLHNTSVNEECKKQLSIEITLMYLAEEASVLVNKDWPSVNEHRRCDTPSGQGGYSQSFLDTVSHHQCSSRVVCQRGLKQ